jgi:hypothetical protein
MITIIITPVPRISFYRYRNERPSAKIYFIKPWSIGKAYHKRAMYLSYLAFLSRKHNKSYIFIMKLNKKLNWEGNIKQVDVRIRQLADEIIFYSGNRYG